MYTLKITIRRLFKNKVFTLINLLGLVIGISSFLVLFLHVSNEKSFDKHIVGNEQIYRVTSVPTGSENTVWARGLGFIHAASANIPEVELATQFTHCNEGSIKMGEHAFQQNDIMTVDKAFVEMFGVEATVGNLNEIDKPNTVFISEDFAKKHFGNLNPLGQTINVEALQYLRNLGEFEIRGIVKNTHPKTHFKYELLLSQKGRLQERFTTLPTRKVQWTYNYFKLKKGVAAQLVADKVKAAWDQSSTKQSRGPKEFDFALFPMNDIHLKSDFRFELRESSSKINISLFVIVSLVILLVSLLNFTNLTIAKLIKHSKELGLKKSIGATQGQLIKQVLLEVLLFCAVAIIISLVLIQSGASVINRLFEIEFQVFYYEPIVYFSILAVVASCLAVTALFVVGFLFGRNSTLDILSERNNFSGNNVLKTLLVGQVAIVVILISGTLLVNKQIDFVLNKPLGFDKENVVVLHVKDFSKDAAVFARELEKQSQVVSVGFAAQHLGYPTQTFDLQSFGMDGTAELVFANYDYLKTMKIALKENWITEPNDTVSGMVINEHLYNRILEKYGSVEALDAYTAAQPLQPDQRRFSIVGVSEDFNYYSAHENIGDFAFFIDEGGTRARYTHVRINNLHAGMESIKRVWEEHYPGQKMNYFFIDDKITQQYKAETILSRILLAFTSIGIFLSIIGISALALFISQQRTKEIGIRKVNGASMSEILTLLNLGFVKWIGIALLIATPVSWYALSKWLENFAYKTTLSWWIFALAGVVTLLITLITVSWLSWKAATRNPVESLRYD